MDKLKKVFLPGHESDDKPMHDDDGTKNATDTPQRGPDQTSQFAPSGTDGTPTEPSGTARSGLEPPVQSQAQSQSQRSDWTPEVAGTSGGTNTSMGREPYPPTAQQSDSSASANLRDDPYSTKPEGGKSATVGQTSTYSSYPLAKGDGTSHTIDRGSNDPTTYRQAEKMSADRGLGVEAGSGAGAGAGAAEAATGHAWPTRSGNNSSAREAGSTEAGVMAAGADSSSAGDGDHFGSRKTMPGQFPAAGSENPYATSHLDPRVDPHATPQGTGSTSPTGANIGSNRHPGESPQQYGRPSGDRDLRSTKMTAKPFDGPKGTSQPLDGPGGTAAPFGGGGQHHPAGAAPIQPRGSGGNPTTERTIPAGSTAGPSAAAPVVGAADRQDESHTGRYATAGGAATAGGGMMAAHEYPRHQTEEDQFAASKAYPNTVEKSSGAIEREDRAHDKVLAKEEKKAEKEHEKAVKKEEKAAEKEEKAAEKEHEKAVKAEEKREKEHEKAVVKEEKEAEKRADSEHKEKKKGGILGLFKRRRDSKGNEVDHEEDDRADADNDGAGQHYRPNKLTKDPPAGHVYSGDAATPAYADYAIKENDHPGAQTVTGGYTAPAPAHDPNKYTGAAGAPSMGTHEAGKQHGHHKLTKEPPSGVGYSGDSATPAYADYAVQENRHPGAQTVTGGYTAPDPQHDSSRYA